MSSFPLRKVWLAPAPSSVEIVNMVCHSGLYGNLLIDCSSCCTTAPGCAVMHLHLCSPNYQKRLQKKDTLSCTPCAQNLNLHLRCAQTDANRAPRVYIAFRNLQYFDLFTGTRSQMKLLDTLKF